MIVSDTLSRNLSFDLWGADNENQILLSDLTEQLRNEQADDEVLKAITTVKDDGHVAVKHALID